MVFDHTFAMREAIRLSREKMNANIGGPFGAIIILDGKIIGRGWNQVTSSNDPTAHAEIVAIRDACHHLNQFSLKGAILYTSCEPCPMCLAATYWARIDCIYYGNTRQDAAAIGFDDEFLYQEISKNIENRQLPIKPLLSDEALTVFKEWELKTDKICY